MREPLPVGEDEHISRREFNERIIPWLIDHDNILRAHDRWIERAKGFMTGLGLVFSIQTFILGLLMFTGKVG